FDNLHDPHGLLQSAMERACALWGSRRAFFLVNGSTCGILAAVKTCCAFGGKILLGRNAHRSVYNAVDLFHLDPVYLAPEPSVTGIPGGISPENVARALEREPEIQTVVITSPTYEGVVSDIASIARIVHGYGKTLIVDEAHGAHFGFGHGFPDSAVNQGADVVIHSLHKTLPSLTQTGIVHICSERVSPAALADALAVFETSSPSYLLMTSIDGCVSLLRQQGEKLFSAWENALDGFYHRCRTLEKLRILQGKDRDRSKILILTDRADLSGPELGERLRREHRIEPEMCLPDGVLAMTGMGDSEQTLTALSDALQQIDSSLSLADGNDWTVSPSIPQKRFAPWQREQTEGVSVPFAGSTGKTCLEYIWAYPPGIPWIVPGEQITSALLEAINASFAAGISLKSTKGGLPEKIFVQK
ncbi:MAG: hypothetical protein IJ259_00405, partial [Oscillospiraceae bacterium]|nr:hypothetical protein [Oscillospiraceae bacterium]